MTHRWFACLLVLGVMQTFARIARSDDSAAKKEKLSAWQQLFRQHAVDYQFMVEGDSQAAVKLVREPVLNWSQPVRGGADGAVFVWTQGGRPTMIGTFFIWPTADGRQGIAHELHSLTQMPQSATWRDRKWNPPGHAVEWKPLSDGPAPGVTPEARLRQMRDLARQFQTESHDKNQRKWELRLLPRPIFRYQLLDRNVTTESSSQLVDGALFGFVEGTDLEVILAMEAYKSKAGDEWKYAFARMSDFRLLARLRGKTVWEVESGSADVPNLPYYCTTVEFRKAAEEK